MKFRYDGPFDEVEVPELGATVQHGHQVEATGETAESLLKQSDWTRVDKPKPRSTASESAPAAADTTTSTED